MSNLRIDCGSCVMKDLACSDCVVGVMLSTPLTLEAKELEALAVLADRGLVPTLKMRRNLATGS